MKSLELFLLDIPKRPQEAPQIKSLPSKEYVGNLDVINSHHSNDSLNWLHLLLPNPQQITGCSDLFDRKAAASSSTLYHPAREQHFALLVLMLLKIQLLHHLVQQQFIQPFASNGLFVQAKSLGSLLRRWSLRNFNFLQSGEILFKAS